MSEHTSDNIELKNLRVLRQALFLASVLIIVGTFGFMYIHPYFLALPVLVAGGLMLSSLVGWCPMIFFLEMAPWNRVK